MRHRPIDPEHTLLRTTWLVHKDAVEGRDYDPKELSLVWRATNKQDGALVERTHQGTLSPARIGEPAPIVSPYTRAELVDAVPGKWNADGDEVLVCCHVRSETHDVKSFLFRTRLPSLFRYRPGQFITLELEIDGEPINRCYTLSSTPTRPDTISITVKRVPGGKVSNWLHDNALTPLRRSAAAAQDGL